MSLHKTWALYARVGTKLTIEQLAKSDFCQIGKDDAYALARWLVKGPQERLSMPLEAAIDDSLLDCYTRLGGKASMLAELARISHEYLPVRVMRRCWAGFEAVPRAGDRYLLPAPHWPESMLDMERRINRNMIPTGIEAMVVSGEWDRRHGEATGATEKEDPPRT